MMSFFFGPERARPKRKNILIKKTVYEQICEGGKMNIQHLIPDGSFETISKCPFCDGTRINYDREYLHIKATCGDCGNYIKFVKQWRNPDDWAQEVKRRDQYTCQRCGAILSPRSAKAHHKLPKWFIPGMEFDINNGICLCKDCHAQIHGAGGTIREEDNNNGKVE